METETETDDTAYSVQNHLMDGMHDLQTVLA